MLRIGDRPWPRSVLRSMYLNDSGYILESAILRFFVGPKWAIACRSRTVSSRNGPGTDGILPRLGHDVRDRLAGRDRAIAERFTVGFRGLDDEVMINEYAVWRSPRA